MFWKEALSIRSTKQRSRTRPQRGGEYDRHRDRCGSPDSHELGFGCRGCQCYRSHTPWGALKRSCCRDDCFGTPGHTAKGSDVILVSYENRDPQIATLVLQELLNRYFVKHLEVHRSAGAFDFVTQQTDQVRARLNQTEDALKALREKTGITSFKDGSDALASDTVKTKEQLNAAESDLLEQQALATQLGKSKPKQWRSKTSTSEKTVDSVKGQIAGTQAKIEALKARLLDIQQRTKQLSDLGPQIQELERRREMDETNYKVLCGIA